jgi:hypothetical protein
LALFGGQRSKPAPHISREKRVLLGFHRGFGGLFAAQGRYGEQHRLTSPTRASAVRLGLEAGAVAANAVAITAFHRAKLLRFLLPEGRLERLLAILGCADQVTHALEYVIAPYAASSTFFGNFSRDRTTTTTKPKQQQQNLGSSAFSSCCFGQRTTKTEPTKTTRATSKTVRRRANRAQF